LTNDLRRIGIVGSLVVGSVLLMGIAERYRPAIQISPAGKVTSSGETKGIVKSLKDGEQSTRIAVVQLDDGALVDAMVTPDCVVAIGARAKLSILHVDGFSNQLYMVIG
jgi:predicted nucleotide-binding protein (sugar kinase/HSP70/actin superfamily)